MNFDLIVIGSGPGGYVAAIRSAQLGLKTAIIEKEELGGVCLNWGCIPTKALLKSASVFDYLKNAEAYGLSLDKKNIRVDFPTVIKRSRKIVQKMNNGIYFLMRKNKIEVIFGTAKLKAGKKISVSDKEGKIYEYTAHHIILATGASSKNLPNLIQDGKKIIGYRQALSLSDIPKNMIVVGSGAIGVEFAYFYNSMGSKITLVEYLDRIVPSEDLDISQQLERSFKKSGIEVLTSSSIDRVDLSQEKVKVFIKRLNKSYVIDTDIILSAVGVEPNIEGIGLEEIGIKTDKGHVITDHLYRTSVQGYYAIGDLLKGPALAHVASSEGIICVEQIKGLDPEILDYENIPGCIYCSPEIASVGLTEEKARGKGYNLKIGKFPFVSLGKATANGDTEGFIKVIFDAKYGEWLGCHMIGTGVTEIIAQVVTARKLETTSHEILKSVFPHPTLSEAIIEATASAYNECIHL